MKSGVPGRLGGSGGTLELPLAWQAGHLSQVLLESNVKPYSILKTCSEQGYNLMYSPRRRFNTFKTRVEFDVFASA